MSVTAMEHILVLTEDIENTREFYCRGLGLRDGERPPLEFPGYWLYAGSAACVHVADRPAYRDHAAGLGLRVDADRSGDGAIDHIAFNATGYSEICERLERLGIRFTRNTVPGGGPRQLFLEDPNGVRIEINVRTTEVRD
jgi:catechol 2,3-dioxygenase-like lactoylglutathione lyase family enzyme